MHEKVTTTPITTIKTGSMDVLNISNFTNDSASIDSAGLVSLDTISFLHHGVIAEGDLSIDIKEIDAFKVDENEFAIEDDATAIGMDENEEEEENMNQIAFTTDDSCIMEESLVFGLASSFPVNLNDDSFELASAAESMMSASCEEYDASFDDKPGLCSRPFSENLSSNEEQRIDPTTTVSIEGEEQGEQGSTSPYAQLCFDRKHKSVVAMLEIDIVNGRRKRRSRLPLDAPDTSDFPWLHPDTTNKVVTSEPGDDSMTADSSISQKESSSTSSNGSASSEDEDEECEPIILSGWMIHVEEMSEEEADIYWLLNDGNDVWLKVDDGCAKALKKMWTSCSRWKLKRSTQFHTASLTNGDEDPQREKRFRYSML